MGLTTPNLLNEDVHSKVFSLPNEKILFEKQSYSQKDESFNDSLIEEISKQRSKKRYKYSFVSTHKKNNIINNAIKKSCMSNETVLFSKRRIVIESIIDSIDDSVTSSYKQFTSILNEQAQSNFNQWEWKAMGMASLGYHMIVVLVVGILATIVGTLAVKSWGESLGSLNVALLVTIFGMPISVLFSSLCWTIRKLYVEKKIIKGNETKIKERFKPHIEKLDIFSPKQLKRNLEIKTSLAVEELHKKINDERLFKELVEKSLQKSVNKKGFYCLLQEYTDEAIGKLIEEAIKPFSLEGKCLEPLVNITLASQSAINEKKHIENQLLIKLWLSWMLHNSHEIGFSFSKFNKNNIGDEKLHLINFGSILNSFFNKNNSDSISKLFKDSAQFSSAYLTLKIDKSNFGCIIQSNIKSLFSDDDILIFQPKKQRKNQKSIDITIKLPVLLKAAVDHLSPIYALTHK